MGQKQHTTIHFALLLLLPVVITLLLYPVWFTDFADECSFAVMIMNTIGYPLYFSLVTWCFVFNPNISLLQRQRYMSIGFWSGLVGMIICVFIQYWSWGASTGLFFNPDSGTLLLMPMVAVAAGVNLIIGMLYVQAKARKEFGDYF